MTRTHQPWSRIDSGPVTQAQTPLTQERLCPVCAANSKRPLLTLEDFQFFSDSATLPKRCRIRQVQCRHCYTIYMDPVYSPAGFDTLFAEAGASYGASEGRVEEQVAWLDTHDLLQTGRTVIDLGCHHGELLAMLPVNLDRVGIDLSQTSIEQAKTLHGDNVIRFLTGNLGTTLPRLDDALITMLHVLEHLPDPINTLKGLRERANPGTRLVVEVPLLELGRTNDINGFLSVTHLTHFSRASLKYCLEASGWSILKWNEQDHYNGCRVLLKPSNGSFLHEAGNPRDLIEANTYLTHWYQAINRVIERLEEAVNTSRVVIWGAGLHTEFLYQLTPLFTNGNDQRFLLIDSDPEKQGKSWRGIPIVSPSALACPELQETPVVISTYRGQESIYKALLELNHMNNNIRLYKGIASY